MMLGDAMYKKYKEIYVLGIILILISFLSFLITYNIVQYNSREYIVEKIWGKEGEGYKEAPELLKDFTLSQDDFSDRIKDYISDKKIEEWQVWMDIWKDFKRIPRNYYKGKFYYIEESNYIPISKCINGFIEVNYKFHLMRGWKIDYIDIDYYGEENGL